MEEIVDNFDTEKFIDEIKNRPALWDSESPEYTNRDLRKICWDDVIKIFFGEDLSASQRRIMQITLRRKWKGIRGCFTRELKRQENVRAGVDPGVRKSEYTHFKQLLFLRNVVSSKTTNSGNEEYLYYEGPIVSTVKQENSIDEDFSQLEDDNSEDNSKLELLDEATSEYSKQDEVNVDYEDKDPLRVVKRYKLKKPRISSGVTEDEDLLFLLSMLKTLQRVPFKKKMATKMKLMAVLDEATKDLDE